MSKIKEAFYNTLTFQDEIYATADNYGTISADLGTSMVRVINQLEFELALYHAGCHKEEVDRLMETVYQPLDI